MGHFIFQKCYISYSLNLLVTNLWSSGMLCLIVGHIRMLGYTDNFAHITGSYAILLQWMIQLGTVPRFLVDLKYERIVSRFKDKFTLVGSCNIINFFKIPSILNCTPTFTNYLETPFLGALHQEKTVLFHSIGQDVLPLRFHVPIFVLHLHSEFLQQSYSSHCGVKRQYKNN